MFKYMIKRILFFFLTFFIVFTLTFTVANVANLDTWLRGYTLWELIGISFDSYWVYLKQIITEWDFGMYNINESMYDQITSDIPITFKMNLYAFLVYVPLGVILGMLSAYFHKTMFEKVVQYITLLLGSIPSYLIILLLMLYVGYEWGWLPPRYDANPDTAVSFFKSVSMPVIAMSLTPLSMITRTMHGELLENKHSEYLELVKTKGLSKWQMMWRHLFRNSLIPLITQIPVIFAMVLSMSFIIEITYDIHGAAKIFYESVIIPSIDGNYLSINIEAVTLVGSFYFGLVLLMGLATDFMLALIDPRVKLGSKKSSY